MISPKIIFVVVACQYQITKLQTFCVQQVSRMNILGRIPKKLKEICLSKIILLAGYLLIYILFILQSSLNLKLFSENKTVYEIKIIHPDSYHFPELSICSWFHYNPGRLFDIGLDTNSDFFYQVLSNVETLNGIDQNMTGKQLEEDAAFTIGDMLEAVVIDGHEINYNTDTRKAEHFSITYDTRAPCLRFSPPPVKNANATLTVKFNLKKMLQACSWNDENGNIVQYENTYNCDSVNKHCNTSCGWEDFISVFGVNSPLNILHQSTSHSSYTMNLFPLPVMLKENSIKLEEYKVTVLDYNPKQEKITECINKCISDVVPQLFNCHPLTKYDLQHPLSSFCSSLVENQDELLRETDCINKCKPTKQTSYWRVISNQNDDGNHLTLSLENKNLKSLYEIESYPISKLLADIGGNLGLFLGQAIFSMLLVVLSSFSSCLKKKLRVGKIVHTMFRYLLLSAFFMICSYHMKIIIDSYVDQANVYSLGLQTIYCRAGDECKFNSTVKGWAAVMLSTRALGCKMTPLTPKDTCFATCSNDFSAKLLSRKPQMHTSDLSNCSVEALRRISNEIYILDNTFVNVFDNLDVEMYCEKLCQNKSVVAKDGLIHYPYVSQIYKISLIQVLCSLGGTIGLYFGYSLFDITSVVSKISLSSKIIHSNAYRRLCTMAYFLILIFAAVLILLFQVRIFVQKHPIVALSEFKDISMKQYPTITLCPSYQMNSTFIDRIIEASGNTQRDEEFSHWFAKTYILPDFKCADYSTYGDLYLNNVYEKLVKTEYGFCVSCVLNITEKQYKSTDSARRLCNRFTIRPILETRLDVSFFHIVHLPTEKVIFDGQADIQIYSKSDVSLDMESFSTYSGHRDKTGPVYNDCYLSCLKYENVPIEYHNIIGKYEAAGNRSNVYIDQVKDISVFMCANKCKESQFTYYSGSVPYNGNDVPVSGIGSLRIKNVNFKYSVLNFCLCTKFDSLEKYFDNDGYTLTQLISDIGGIAGFVLGMSLLIIWKQVYISLKNTRLRKLQPEDS